MNIYDDNNKNIAQISDDKYFGFDSENFSFTPLEIEDDSCRAVIYMPNNGYRIVFSYGNETGVAVDFEAVVSTLDADGWKSVSITDTESQTSENGLLASYDGTQNIINDSNILEIVSGTVQNHLTDWKLPISMELDFDAEQKIGIIGEDTELVSSDLVWGSSDESIVSVSSDGTAKAVGYGKVTISVTDGNKTESCEVTVKLNITELNFQNIVMTVGERTVISPDITPTNATQSDIVYTYKKGTVIKMKNQPEIKIHMSEDLLRKFIFISQKEGRTPNNQFLFMLRNNIQYFEKTKGRITPSDLEDIDISEYTVNDG